MTTAKPSGPQWTRDGLARDIEKYGWIVGEYSYGVPHILDKPHGKLRIGKFCSIAREVRIVLGNHRIDMVSTYPFRALRHRWPAVPRDVKDHDNKGDVVIGDDVWIGTGSLILSGAQIGPGAVVGGHAVVRGTVPPYAIVAGNPARIIRYRLEPPIIERLLRVAWWNWDTDRVNRMLPRMLSNDIEAFLAEAEADGA